jgi:hypothetical protein
MDTASTSATDYTLLYGIALAAIVLAGLFFLVVWMKGRRLPGEHVYRASRWSRGNRLLPAQVVITRESITMYQPQWVGKVEESIHMAHVSSIKIDTNLVFSDVFIETTGGHNPIVCHGHLKRDAVEMKRVIEQYQTERYRRDAGGLTAAPTGGEPPR